MSSRVGDLATAVESKVDKAIAVALDAFLRMPGGPEEVEEGRQEGEERVVL